MLNNGEWDAINFLIYVWICTYNKKIKNDICVFVKILYPLGEFYLRILERLYRVIIFIGECILK